MRPRDQMHSTARVLSAGPRGEAPTSASDLADARPPTARLETAGRTVQLRGRHVAVLPTP